MNRFTRLLGVIGNNLITAGKGLLESACEALVISEGDMRLGGADKPWVELGLGNEMGLETGESVEGAIRCMRGEIRNDGSEAPTFHVEADLPEGAVLFVGAATEAPEHVASAADMTPANDDQPTISHECGYVIVLGGKPQPACTTAVEGEEPHCPKCKVIEAALAARATALKAQPLIEATPQRCQGFKKHCANTARRGSSYCKGCAKAKEFVATEEAAQRMIDELPRDFQRAVNANDDGASLKALLKRWQGEVKPPASAGSWQYAIVVTVRGAKRSITVIDERLHAKIVADKAEAAEKARMAQVEAARVAAEARKNAPKAEAKPVDAKSKGKDKGNKGGKGQQQSGKSRHQHASA